MSELVKGAMRLSLVFFSCCHLAVVVLFVLCTFNAAAGPLIKDYNYIRPLPIFGISK